MWQVYFCIALGALFHFLATGKFVVLSTTDAILLRVQAMLMGIGVAGRATVGIVGYILTACFCLELVRRLQASQKPWIGKTRHRLLRLLHVVVNRKLLRRISFGWIFYSGAIVIGVYIVFVVVLGGG